MASVTYKCPNCGSFLAFDPDDQKWKCDRCDSVYDEETLLAKAAEYQQQADAEHRQAEADAHTHAAAAADAGSEQQVYYNCPSCGSGIMTDETTVATHCYYCHNPVVLQGKLTADMKPDMVLPFSVGKEKAIEAFMGWVAKKRFVPKGFFAREQVRQMEGVYYPHFVTEATVDGSYQGEGQRTNVFDQGQYVVTQTEHYAITRRAKIAFENVMRPALKATDRKLSDGIHPFPLTELTPFSGAYLSGFLAERRDIAQSEATADVADELTGYVKPLLTQTVHFPTYQGKAEGRVLRQSSKYVLLPTWVLTYIKSGEKEPYYYVMNGRTGQVCGKLPIDKGKLRLTALGITAILFAAYCVAAYFLF